MSQSPRMDKSDHRIRELAMLSNSPAIVPVTEDILIVRAMSQFGVRTSMSVAFIQGALRYLKYNIDKDRVREILAILERIKVVYRPLDDDDHYELSEDMRDLIREFRR